MLIRRRIYRPPLRTWARELRGSGIFVAHFARARVPGGQERIAKRGESVGSGNSAPATWSTEARVRELSRPPEYFVPIRSVQRTAQMGLKSSAPRGVLEPSNGACVQSGASRSNENPVIVCADIGDAKHCRGQLPGSHALACRKLDGHCRRRPAPHNCRLEFRWAFEP